MRNYIYILLSILVLSFCSPPPSEPEPVKPAIVKSSEIIKKETIIQLLKDCNQKDHQDL